MTNSENGVDEILSTIRGGAKRVTSPLMKSRSPCKTDDRT
jgi:hypothetical protein